MTIDELYDRMEASFIEPQDTESEEQVIMEMSEEISKLMTEVYAKCVGETEKPDEFNKAEWPNQFRKLLESCPTLKAYIAGSDFVCFFRRIEEITKENQKPEYYPLARVCGAKIKVFLRAIIDGELRPL